jgi:hypothetical protein
MGGSIRRWWVASRGKGQHQEEMGVTSEKSGGSMKGRRAASTGGFKGSMKRRLVSNSN